MLGEEGGVAGRGVRCVRRLRRGEKGHPFGGVVVGGSGYTTVLVRLIRGEEEVGKSRGGHRFWIWAGIHVLWKGR